MRLVMVNAQKGLAQGKREGLGRLEADHQGVRQARSTGGGDGLQVRGGDLRNPQGLLSDGQEVSEMFASGQLRDHAAVLGMEPGLGGNDVREDLALMDDGSARFVAGSFDGDERHFAAATFSPLGPRFSEGARLP